MSMLDDWGTSLSRPFQRTIAGFKQVFTNPGKANFGDFLSVVFPFAGGTIASDYNHPTDTVYQAGTLAALVGGAYAFPAAHIGTAFAEYGTGTQAAAGTPELLGGILSNTTPAALGSELAQFPAVVPGVATPASLGVGGASSGGGILAALSDAGAAVGSFITKVAGVSTAAKAILSPWERTVNAIKDAISPGPSGSSVNVISGGAGLGQPDNGPGAPVQASMPNLLIIGLAVTVVVGLIWAWLKGKKK
jgi:hypothetical protein